MNIVEVRDMEKREIHIVDMLGQQSDADALVAHIGEDSQYLLVVCH